MKTTSNFSRVWQVLPDGTKKEISPYFLEEKQNQTALVVSVTKRELRLLLEGKIDLLIRDSFPRNLDLPMPIYFTAVHTQGKITAKGWLFFVMHTIGISQELERAAMKSEKFEKKFYKPKYEMATAYAWNLRCIEACNLTFEDFVTFSKNKCPQVMKHLTRAFAYVVRR